MPDSGAPPAPPVRLVRAHLAARRARLRPEAEIGRTALVELANTFAGIAGIDRVLARPSTGSLIVETHRPATEVLAEMEACDLVRLVPAPQPPPLRQQVQTGIARADSGLKSRTGEALDLRTAIGLALLAAAILQLARGRVAGPFTTLALAALSMLDNGRAR
ncbi:hypothetical protein [Rhodovulum sp. ES.010]|uniref:hypothetical protein n=1 Tax=Rhodovulum sp. ES.010 TaxID=1882821 RepID=UPI0011151396|nr:hypothetical protein [Rhodovulum sp. ES.010]